MRLTRLYRLTGVPNSWVPSCKSVSIRSFGQVFLCPFVFFVANSPEVLPFNFRPHRPISLSRGQPTNSMLSFRYIVPSLALIAALVLAGCGPSKQPAKTAPAVEPVVVAPKSDEPPKPEFGAKPNPKLEGVASARIEHGYVTLLYENGRKGQFPSGDLTADEAEWLNTFAAAHPLAHGKSTIVTAKTEVKKTIEKQSMIEG